MTGSFRRYQGKGWQIFRVNLCLVCTWKQNTL